MSLETILKKAITPIRLSPHGVTLITLGAVTWYLGNTLPKDFPLYPLFGVGMGSLGGGILGYGIGSYNHGLYTYLKSIKNIKKYGSLEEKSIHRNAKHYCSRQAARTAAINHNLQQEFDQHFATYTGEMQYKYLPLL